MIPPQANAAFVAAMEEILAVYARPLDPTHPLVCFDECGKDLKAHTRPPQLVAPGRAAREDADYLRGGSVNGFLACAPHLGWRHLTLTARRTALDFAHALRELVDVHFPDATRIVLVTDNLNTHRPAALYQAFPPAEAWRILAKLEWHYTPKHGSWLNIAELELSVLQRQCLQNDTAATSRYAERVILGVERSHLVFWRLSRQTRCFTCGRSMTRRSLPALCQRSNAAKQIVQEAALGERFRHGDDLLLLLLLRHAVDPQVLLEHP